MLETGSYRARLERSEREEFERYMLERYMLERRVKLERLDAIRLERRARGIIDIITEEEKRTLLLRANTISYEYIEELIAKYGPITDVIFNILISGRAGSFDLLFRLLTNYQELITEDNFNKIITLDPPHELPPSDISPEHFIVPHNPLYKPRDIERIIHFLIDKYPRLLTEHNIEQIRQYICLELDYIHRLKTFYRDSRLNEHPEVISKIIILNKKEECLQQIRQILIGQEIAHSEYSMLSRRRLERGCTILGGVISSPESAQSDAQNCGYI
jgi:hypothetical protein